MKRCNCPNPLPPNVCLAVCERRPWTWLRGIILRISAYRANRRADRLLRELRR